MVHQHTGTCGCEADDHIQLDSTAGELDSLYLRIDRDNVVALNAEEGKEGKIVFRPWDERNQEAEWLQSDADEQLIFHIPFTGSIKLRAIAIKAGPAQQTPESVKIFVNQRLDFDEASSQTPAQVIEIPLTREVVEYPLKPAKFPTVTTLTLFFPANHGAETSRISFIGFKGEYQALNKKPIITVYEAQANPADHKKIPGIDNVNNAIN